MTFLKILFLLLLSGTISASSIDFDQFDLTEEQKEVLMRLEERGVEHSAIIRAARALERHNRGRDVYIPDHTWAEITELQHWATGEAFSDFATRAGVEFDRKRYLEDCPNWELFNFLRATGNEHIRNANVLVIYEQTFFALNYYWNNLPSLEFQEKYLEMIQRTQHIKYLENF